MQFMKMFILVPLQRKSQHFTNLYLFKLFPPQPLAQHDNWRSSVQEIQCNFITDKKNYQVSERGKSFTRSVQQVKIEKSGHLLEKDIIQT